MAGLGCNAGDKSTYVAPGTGKSEYLDSVRYCRFSSTIEA